MIQIVKQIRIIHILVILISSFNLTPLSSSTNNMLAVVNNSFVIFDYDVDRKIKFMQLTTHDTIYNHKNIRSIILNQLINNYLILQDSKLFKVQVNAQEVAVAIENIEKKLKMPQGTLLTKVEQAGILRNYFLLELQNELVVEKTKKGISLSRAHSSNKEIESETQRTLHLNGTKEYYLSEIDVYINNKKLEDAKKKIYLIYNSLKSYKDFAKVANAFSENISTRSGGDIGWVPEVYLSALVAKQLKETGKNQFTKPILTNNYYKIFLVKDMRPLLYLDTNNPEHMKKLQQFIKQKLIYEKSQIALDDYLKDIYNNASITFYNQ